VSITPAIYLDYAATTPVDPLVARAMGECLTIEGDFGNAASVHAYGQGAAARVAHARAQVAALLGAAPQEIYFTSGATEANNLAILGAARARADRPAHLVTLRTEHKAVLDCCRHLERTGARVTYLTPARDGLLSVAALAAALRPETVLVSIMHANNETGVLQDIGALAGLCRERGVALHCDGAQSAARVAIDVRALGVDFFALTAHKLYGPKGIGALYVRHGARALLQPLFFGGGQERGLRPGTLPVHQIVGFGAACELAQHSLATEAPRLTALDAQLWRGLSQLYGVHLNGAQAPRVPGIQNVSFENVEGESLVSALPGLALATGAACNSATGEPSYVLRALGRDARLAESSLRFSLGRYTTAAELEQAIAAVRTAVERLRALSPACELPPTAGRAVSGEAGTQGEGTWVRFQLLLEGNNVKEARFKAFACPHTVETARWLCQQLRGRTRADLLPGTPAQWARACAVPVEKLGRLLVVEDALRACLTHWTEGATM
jgi:cysteine desulfurase